MPKLRRPTIPIADWRIAVHLDATRAIQNQPGTPAYGCDCEWCTSWPLSYQNILPKDLVDQFSRVGVDVRHPTDIYGSMNFELGSLVRATFHVVGKIIDGPVSWVGTKFGSMQTGQILREDPWLLLRVVPHRECRWDPAPKLEDPSAGDVLAVDMRLAVLKTMLEKGAAVS